MTQMDERIKSLESYVEDMRRAMHIAMHTLYLLGSGGDLRCTACGNLLREESGEFLRQ